MDSWQPKCMNERVHRIAIVAMKTAFTDVGKGWMRMAKIRAIILEMSLMWS